MGLTPDWTRHARRRNRPSSSASESAQVSAGAGIGAATLCNPFTTVRNRPSCKRAARGIWTSKRRVIPSRRHVADKERLMSQAGSPSRRRFIGALGLGGLLTAWRPRAGRLAAQAPAAPPTPRGAPWWAVAVGRRRPGRRLELDHPREGARRGQVVRDGKIYRLGRTYEAGMPLFGTRTFSVTDPRRAHRRAVRPQQGRVPR